MDFTHTASVLGSDVAVLEIFTSRECLSLVLVVLVFILLFWSVIEDGWTYRHVAAARRVLVCNFLLAPLFFGVLYLLDTFAESNVWYWALVGTLAFWYLYNYRYHVEKVERWNPKPKHIFLPLTTLLVAGVAYVLSLGCLVLPLLFAAVLMSPWYFLDHHKMS